MGNILPRIYKFELSNVLIPVFLLQSLWTQQMRLPFTEQGTWLLNYLTIGCYAASIWLQFKVWRCRQHPYCKLPPNARPRVPFPIDATGKPIL